MRNSCQNPSTTASDTDQREQAAADSAGARLWSRRTGATGGIATVASINSVVVTTRSPAAPRA